MIIHAGMPCFSQYRVYLNKEEITRACYMADETHGVVLVRQPGPQGQGYVYEEKRGTVTIRYAGGAVS